MEGQDDKVRLSAYSAMDLSLEVKHPPRQVLTSGWIIDFLVDGWDGTLAGIDTGDEAADWSHFRQVPGSVVRFLVALQLDERKSITDAIRRVIVQRYLPKEKRGRALAAKLIKRSKKRKHDLVLKTYLHPAEMLDVCVNDRLFGLSVVRNLGLTEEQLAAACHHLVRVRTQPVPLPSDYTEANATGLDVNLPSPPPSPVSQAPSFTFGPFSSSAWPL